MKYPKVSVILPVYNMEKYLRESLDSLRNQTLKEIEIICFNDASTDNSLSILKEYSKKDERIKIIDSKNNIKQGGGRNAGIRMSSAPYIMFVDPDDWVSPLFVEKYYIKAVENDADLVTGDYICVMDSLETPVSPFGKNIEVNNKSLIRKRFKSNVPIWVNLYKKQLFYDYDLFFPENLQIGEDVILSFSVFFVAKKICKIDDELYYYRILNTSSSHKIDFERSQQRFKSAVITLNKLHSLDSKGEYTEEINEAFIHLYYSLSVWWAVTSKDPEKYKIIKYANKNITKYVSINALNHFISTQERNLKIVFRVSRYSAILSVLLFKSIRTGAIIKNGIKNIVHKILNV